MSIQMSPETIKLVHKLDDIPKKDFKTILPSEKGYMTELEKKQAADLLEKLLNWVPSDRITCDKALKHEFFKGH
jgi:serine/threonine protein kinase